MEAFGLYRFMCCTLYMTFVALTGGLTEKTSFFHFLCEFHLLPPEGLSTLDLISSFNMHSNEFELVLGLTQ